MGKYFKIATLGSLMASAVLGAWFYAPHRQCTAQQTAINLQGYYEFLPERAAKAAAIQCSQNGNEVEFSGSADARPADEGAIFSNLRGPQLPSRSLPSS